MVLCAFLTKLEILEGTDNFLFINLPLGLGRVHEIQSALKNFNGLIKPTLLLLVEEEELSVLFEEALVGVFGAPGGAGQILLYRCGGSFWSSGLRKGDKIPFEVQPPVEPSPHHRGRAVGQRVGADDVDHGAHHRPAVFLDGGQQGLQPHHVHLAVAVQEHQHLS